MNALHKLAKTFDARTLAGFSLWINLISRTCLSLKKTNRFVEVLLWRKALRLLSLKQQCWHSHLGLKVQPQYLCAALVTETCCSQHCSKHYCCHGAPASIFLFLSSSETLRFWSFANFVLWREKKETLKKLTVNALKRTEESLQCHKKIFFGSHYLLSYQVGIGTHSVPSLDSYHLH